MTQDGSVETTLPDGSKRISRPGECGHVTVFPNGKRQVVSCMQTPKATPPLPDPVSGAWLDAHCQGLLEIARALLGNDQTSIDNYLQSNENSQQSVYDRIRLRTSLLAQLSGPN